MKIIELFKNNWDDICTTSLKTIQYLVVRKVRNKIKWDKETSIVHPDLIKSLSASSSIHKYSLWCVQHLIKIIG